MFRWLHHLLEPHCKQCAFDRDAEKICPSCETLKTQLDIANYDKKILIQRLIELTKPEIPIPNQVAVNLDEIKPRTVPWHVRRQMLEAEDRKEATLRAAAKREAEKVASDIKRGPSGGVEVSIDESIAELEKELGIDEKGATVNGT